MTESDRARLRAQLDQIDQWLTEPGGGALWDVLSALRGPDDESISKGTTTIPIRVAAFPKMAGVFDRYYYSHEVGIKANFDHRYSELRLGLIPPGHFLQHIRSAALVLGLRFES